MAGWLWSLKGAALHSHLLHSPSRIPQKSRGAGLWRVRCTIPPHLSHPLQPRLAAMLLLEWLISFKQRKMLTFSHVILNAYHVPPMSCISVFPGSCSVKLSFNGGRGSGYKVNIEKSGASLYLATKNKEFKNLKHYLQ